MNQNDRLKLQANYKKLTEVMYSSVSPHLISTFVLDLDMHADIDCCPTDKKKMEKLLQLLPSRGASALKELISALRTSYGWLATHLEEEVTVPNYDAICSDIRNYCNNNNIPASGVTNSALDNLKDISVSTHEKSVEKIMQSSIMLCSKWTILSNVMDLSPCLVADIRRNMVTEGGTMYAIHTMLAGWVSQCGPSKATFARLIHLVESEGFNDVTEKLIDIWTTLQ